MSRHRGIDWGRLIGQIIGWMCFLGGALDAITHR
jgi:hypothetical protein